jgi:parallel beta-helix repeat protein
VGFDTDNHSGQNVVAFNLQDGILVASVALGVTIRGNSIHDNGELGIELSVSEAPGVTPVSATSTATAP